MENEIIQKVSEPSILQSFAIFMNEGGIFMWIILAIWIFGMTIAIERIKSLFSYDTDGSSLMNIIKKNVLSNKVSVAIIYCSDSKALLPVVLRSGLKRANQTGI